MKKKEDQKGKVACVILGAGMSVRFGGIKQLVTLKRGKTLIQNAIDLANGSKADYVVLVVGAHSSNILAKVQTGRAQVVLNTKYRSGLSTSVKCGVASLPSDCEAAIFMVADQPNLTSKIINRMIDKHAARKQPCIVALSFRKQPRNPVLIPRGLFSEALQLKGDVGARDIVRKHLGETSLMDVRDAQVFLDIDTKSSLQKATRSQE